MKRVLFVLLIISSFAQPAESQEVKAPGTILFHGMVMDSKSLVPLPNTHILVNRLFLFLSNNEGKFAFQVNRMDTVIFRRVGYKPAVLNISDTLRGKEYLTGIFMHADTLQAGEVIIIPRLTNLKSVILGPNTKPQAEIENAKYNLALSAYQGRVSQGRIGDPASNYDLLRQRQRENAYSKGQLSSDRIAGLNPFMLLPGLYLLMNGLPEKPAPLQPNLTEQEIIELHREYLESLNRKK